MMYVLCVANRVSALADHQRSRGETERSTYPITPGRSYPVLGMLLWENVFCFLVRSDSGGPVMAPAGFFELGTWKIPPGWSFGLCPPIRASGRDLWADGTQARWGYYEYVHDPEHQNQLLECEPEALAIFARYLLEAESAQENLENDNKQPFLVGYDTGKGILWGLLYARSAYEIKDLYPELAVLTKHPRWVTPEEYMNLVCDPLDIDEPPSGLLEKLINDRS